MPRPSGFAWLLFIAFLLDVYIPDPIPLADELGLGLLLIYNSRELAVLAIITMCLIYFFTGLVPTPS